VLKSKIPIDTQLLVDNRVYLAARQNLHANRPRFRSHEEPEKKKKTNIEKKKKIREKKEESIAGICEPLSMFAVISAEYELVTSLEAYQFVPLEPTVDGI